VPTIALLRRSFGRMERLLQLIRAGKLGGDDARLAAEDDADRASWRGGMTGALGALPGNSPSRRQSGGAQVGNQVGGTADAPTQRTAPPPPAGQRSKGRGGGGAGGASEPQSRDEMWRASQGGATPAPGPTNRLTDDDPAVGPQWGAANGAGPASGAL